jgi:hypothetical protein
MGRNPLKSHGGEILLKIMGRDPLKKHEERFS